MTGTAYKDDSYPWDADDFGRCYRLLQAFPEWHARLPEVGVAHPIWVPMLNVWGQLESLYEAGKRGLVSGLLREARKGMDGPAGWSSIGPNVSVKLSRD